MTTVCHLIVNALGDICGERAAREITTPDGVKFPACGMHAMRFKPPDGFGNDPLPEADR